MSRPNRSSQGPARAPVPFSENSGVTSAYPVIQPEDLSDPRPKYPVQLNIKLTPETASQIDALAERLNTPRSAVARRLLVRALEQVADLQN